MLSRLLPKRVRVPSSLLRVPRVTVISRSLNNPRPGINKVPLGNPAQKDVAALAIKQNKEAAFQQNLEVTQKLIAIGYNFQTNNEPEKAKEHYERSINLLLKIKETHPKTKELVRILATAYINMGEIYAAKTDYENAEIYAKKATDLFEEDITEAELDELTAAAYANVTEYMVFQEKMQGALPYGRVALTTFERLFGYKHSASIHTAILMHKIYSVTGLSLELGELDDKYGSYFEKLSGMTPEFQNQVEEEFESQVDQMEKKVSENPQGFEAELQKESQQQNADAGYAPGQYSAATEFDSDKLDILSESDPEMEAARENWEKDEDTVELGNQKRKPTIQTQTENINNNNNNNNTQNETKQKNTINENQQGENKPENKTENKNEREKEREEEEDEEETEEDNFYARQEAQERLERLRKEKNIKSQEEAFKLLNEKLEEQAADWQPSYMKTEGETNIEEIYKHQQETLKNPTHENVRIAMDNMWMNIAKMKENMTPAQFEELQEVMEAGASFENIGGTTTTKETKETKTTKTMNEEVAEEMKRVAEDLDMPDIGDVNESNPGLKEAMDAFRKTKNINFEEEEEVIEHDNVKDIDYDEEEDTKMNNNNNSNNNKDKKKNIVYDEDKEDEEDSEERRRRRERYNQEE